MKIYKVLVSDSKFEHEFISDKCDLPTLNRLVMLSSSGRYLPLLNSSDASLIKSVGGTVIYREGKEYSYLIDIDFVINKNFNPADKSLYHIFNDIRKSLKRDIKINDIIE
jgi:hypothetical protein